MVYLNTLKIMFNNFSLAFKSFLYKLIAFLIAVAIIFAFAFRPLIALVNDGFLKVLWASLADFSFNGFFQAIVQMQDIFLSFLAEKEAGLVVPLIIAIAVAYILGLTLMKLDKIATQEVLDGKMGSNCKLSFAGMLFARLGFSLKYTFSSVLFYLPIDILILFTVYFELKLFSLTGFWLIIAPFILILSVVILITLRLSLFNSWVPTLVSGGKGVFKSLFMSFEAVFRKFFKTFGNALLIIVTALFLNMLMFSLTAGVGLILTIPATILLVDVFEMVNTCFCTGKRFYNDGVSIVTPKKLETQEDVKNLIDIV